MAVITATNMVPAGANAVTVTITGGDGIEATLLEF